MQPFPQFMKLLNDTWTMRFGDNTTREHDRFDALYGYDSMWLAALALDRAEAKLQNMTPGLTLGDFQYTGKNSTIIKDAIYTSALEVTFTGASVSAHAHMHIHMNTKWSWPYTWLPCHFLHTIYVQGFIKLLPNGDRAPELRYFQYRLNSDSEGKSLSVITTTSQVY